MKQELTIFSQRSARKMDDDYNWPGTLTVEERVGIRTTQPSEALDVIGNISATGDISATGVISATGDISATNLNLNGSLTINQNLTVSGNFQLGTLSVNEFSSDGNLADNSNLAIPTEQAVKTYVDNQINTRAALNGSANQDFATNNLSVDESLTVSNGISTKQLSVSGLLTVENDLTVGNAITTRQLTVSDAVKGSLTIENDLTLGGKVGIGTTTPEADLHVIGRLLGAAQDISGKALRICCGTTPEGSTNWQPIPGVLPGVYVDVDTSVCSFNPPNLHSKYAWKRWELGNNRWKFSLQQD